MKAENGTQIEHVANHNHFKHFNSLLTKEKVPQNEGYIWFLSSTILRIKSCGEKFKKWYPKLASKIINQMQLKPNVFQSHLH